MGVIRTDLIAVIALLVVVTALPISGLTGSLTSVHDTQGSTLQFEDVSTSVGFNYSSATTRFGNGNSGVYVADVNRDGWSDVLAIGAEKPALFVNENGTFRKNALPSVDIMIQGALFFDPDGDGWSDLLLLPRHGEPVFLRNVDGTFRQQDVGLSIPLNVSVAATAADYNHDGRDDLFLVQYGQWANGLPEGYYREARYLEEDNGGENYLFRATEDGFTRVSSAGISGKRWSLATSFADFTGDGWPDIHVTNDFNSDIIYVNQRNGSFEQRILGNETARNGMASEVADVNRDGRPDIFVTNIFIPVSKIPSDRAEPIRSHMHFLYGDRIDGNNLLINRGDGSFVDKASEYGVRKGGWGWSAAIADLDNDGDRDLIHSTSKLVRVNRSDPHYTYPMVWEREGENFTSVDASEIGFGELDGRGLAHLDFDRDGDQDVVIAVANGAYRFYENTGSEGRSIEIRVRSPEGSTIGTTVHVTVAGESRSVLLNAKSDYQSQDTRVAHFGLGEHDRVQQIRVVWPDGTETTYGSVRAGQLLVVTPDGIRQRLNYTSTGSQRPHSAKNSERIQVPTTPPTIPPRQ